MRPLGLDRADAVAHQGPLPAPRCRDRAPRLLGTLPTAVEDFLIPGGDPGVELYLSKKRAASGPGAWPDRPLVHGLTYPGGAVFDLPLDGRSWLDVIAARGYGRLDIFARPAEEAPPYLDAATATRDLEAAAAFIRDHRGLDRIIAWS